MIQRFFKLEKSSFASNIRNAITIENKSFFPHSYLFPFCGIFIFLCNAVSGISNLLLYENSLSLWAQTFLYKVSTFIYWINSFSLTCSKCILIFVFMLVVKNEYSFDICPKCQGFHNDPHRNISICFSLINHICVIRVFLCFSIQYGY